MTRAAVRAVDLVVAYGSKTAIARSTFEIPAGTSTAIIGPNGSGKSTLLSTIAGLLRPAAGSIEVATAAVHRIAYVLQTTKVNDALPISVREVVAMGRYATTGAYRWMSKADRSAIDHAMERMDITAIQGLSLNQLSGGQRQRVFVAQGLAQDHDLLLLDEPLTGIDLPTAHAIDAVIHDEKADGCTVVMTTHDLSEAMHADHVILLSGRVVAVGPPEDVLTRDHLLEAYGPSLLHGGGDEPWFLDDPAHTPVPGRHAHRERTIHTETAPTEIHGDA